MNNEDKIRLAVVAWWRANGYGPSYRDLMELTGIKSTSTIRATIVRLVAQGLLLHDPKIARSVRPPMEVT